MRKSQLIERKMDYLILKSNQTRIGGSIIMRRKQKSVFHLICQDINASGILQWD